MPADATSAIPYITLTPAYRRAQRALGQWLECGHADARRARFAVRAAWAALDATEHDRLMRWLAWLCVAAGSRGDRTLVSRLEQVDATWAQSIARAMHKLPGQWQASATQPHSLRLSA